MFQLILVVIVGLVVAVLPNLPVFPQSVRTFVVDWLLRGFGLLLVAYAIVSTSYVDVPDGYVGHLFKNYTGGPLEKGRIVASVGENGPQAEILSPGFHWSPLINIIYDVDVHHEQVRIPKGKVGLLVARDGAPLRPGQAFADAFSNIEMLDARVFLSNGGQKGPQITVLTPGEYRLNLYLWEVTVADAIEIPAGFVGVVKSNVHTNVDFGPLLKAPKPEACAVIEAPKEETKTQAISAPLVPTGCIGVWKNALQPGQYYLNPTAFVITAIETRAQVWTYAGGYETAEINLTVDAKGDVTQHRNKKTVQHDPKVHADTAVVVRMEGWDVPIELRVVAQIQPEDASCLVAGIGGLREVEDRVITPAIRAIARDVAGGTYTIREPRVDRDGKPINDAEGRPLIETIHRPTKVLDLINQRPVIEGEIEGRIRPEARNSCTTIREVRLGEPAIPPELLVAVRREQLAGQLTKAFQQEKVAQDQRITSEKAKATANQQEDLVKAEIAVQASVQNALAAQNNGRGERDRLTLIAEGQKVQMDVLGAENTVNLRKFELLVEKGFRIIEQHPEILTTALTNAQKFVPNVQVGGGSDGGLGGILQAITGQMLLDPTSKPLARPTAQR